MPRTDLETQTGISLSEKISIGFMVGVGIVVLTSFLAAAGYLGWNKLMAGTPVVKQTLPLQTNTHDETTTNTVTPEIQGEQTDRNFNTE